MKAIVGKTRRDSWHRFIVRIALHFSTLSVLAIGATFIGLLPQLLPNSTYGASTTVFLSCLADGSVSIQDKPESITAWELKAVWDSSMFLSVTLGFGSFTFAQAKA